MALKAILLSLLLGVALSGCNKAPSAVPSEAQQTADVLTGDAAGDASANAECKKFTPAEIAGYAGTPVNAGENAAKKYADRADFLQSGDHLPDSV